MDMKNNGVFEQFDYYRDTTIELLDSITSESKADIIPVGFNNSLRWNLGHILAAQEGIMFYFGKNETGFLPTSVLDAFKTGTSPKDWQTTPLTLKEIRELLIEQKERIRVTFAGEFKQPVANVFAFQDKKLTTIGDLFVFTLWHEGLHQGVIQSMQRIIP